VPHVQPSTLVANICSAPARTPASASRSTRSTPIQVAFEISGPPTSLDTHASVTRRSTSGRLRMSA
jgi:hypothetical protein